MSEYKCKIKVENIRDQSSKSSIYKKISVLFRKGLTIYQTIAYKILNAKGNYHKKLISFYPVCNINNTTAFIKMRVK